MGRGHFGTVKKAFSKDDHDTMNYAIKSILKAKIDTNIHLLERELGILMTVDHPNIVKFFEVYEDVQYIHIVMELCNGGELFDQLLQKGRYTEAEAAKIMHSLLNAVAHLHSLDIAHRDLKPENIMLSTNEPDSEIKIIDFGLAKKYLGQGSGQNTILGSSYYVAPEVLQNSYGLSCDIWSCGVILYMLLSGKAPFAGNSDAAIYEQILKLNYSTEGPEWVRISEEAKDLIKQLLNPDNKMRITAQVALEHKWLEKRGEKETAKIERKVMKRLKQHIHANKIVKETMNILIKTLKQDEIKQLNSIFLELDREHTGFITATELEQGLISAGINLEGEELKGKEYVELLKKADNSIGKLSYSEFLAMTIDRKHLENTDGLWLAFKYFDIQNRGYITKENFSNALKRAGWKLTDNEVDKMLSEYGLEKLDKLHFEQFCLMFQGII
jgi:calcium-dependent protein kinase